MFGEDVLRTLIKAFEELGKKVENECFSETFRRTVEEEQRDYQSYTGKPQPNLDMVMNFLKVRDTIKEIKMGKVLGVDSIIGDILKTVDSMWIY